MEEKQLIKLGIVPLLVATTFLLSACASQRDIMIDQGYPVAYADGYDDGCHSGNKAGGSLFDQFKKDVAKFDADKQYAQGWSDGFKQCESEQEAIQRQVRLSLEQQKLDEQKKHNAWEEKKAMEREALKGVDTSGLKSLSQS